MRSLKQLRKDALDIFLACLRAVDPERAVIESLSVEGNVLHLSQNDYIDLSRFKRIVVFGAGKASAAMAKGLEAVLGEKVSDGVVVVKHGHGLPLKNIDVVESGHPTPTKEGKAAAARMLEIAESLGEQDLVIGCISGGGSSLLSLPASGITLYDKIDITEKLLASGANIFEINVVRKHISQVKGGYLLGRCYPATVVNLMLSDVIGDDPSTIASGPLAPDETTYTVALEVLKKYHLLEFTPVSIVDHLLKGAQGQEQETPNKDSHIFEHVHNVIVGSNVLSLKSGAPAAEHLGYRTLILSSTVRGDTVPAAEFHAYLAEEIRSTGNPIPPPACLLSGGETTVRVCGDGLGGRNQHFVLALVEAASRIDSCLFLSAGTDGTDGPTDAAGAIVDTETFSRSSELGLNPNDYLARYDAYHFFQRLGDLVQTGPTLTNVMDIHIVLLG